jgi:hypothetical protein
MNTTTIFFASTALGMLDTILLARSSSTHEACIVACLMLATMFVATTAATELR